MTNKYTLILITYIFIGHACFANESLPIAYYHIDDWQVENSLGQTTIGDISQNINGDLVVATGLGIKIFDGSGFYEKFDYDSKINRNGIAKMEISHDGMVWGVNQKGVFKFSNTKIHTFKVPIFYNIYNSFALTNTGVPWIVSQNTLLKINKKGEIKKVNNSINATAITQSHDLGAMVIGTKGSVLKVDLTGKILEQVYLENQNLVVLSLFESSDGTYWINTLDGVYLINEKVTHFLSLDKNLKVKKFYEDSKNNIWILTNTGIFVYEDFILKKINISNNHNLRTRGLIEDQYGNIWFGTWGSGLFRLKKPDFNVITTDYNPNAYLSASNGTEWIGSYTGAILKDKESYKQIRIPEVHNNYVTDIEEGLNENIWLLYSSNLVKIDKNGNNPKIISDIFGVIFWFIFKDEKGILWVGTNDGLFYKDLKNNDKFNEFVFDNNEEIRTSIQLNDGKLLFLTNKNAYLYKDGEITESLLTAMFEPENRIVSYDEQSDTVWYYHLKKHAILKFKNNKIQEYKLDKLLKNFIFYNLEIDQNNDLILLGESGVLRIQQKWFNQYDLKDNTDKYLFYETMAVPGNNNSECNSGHNSLMKNLVGVLHLTCKDALLSLKTVHSDIDILPNKPIVKLVGENHKSFEVNFPDGPLEFSPATNSYEFSFVSNSLNEIFPHSYRYKLHGLDENWNIYNKKNKVTYVKLKPGEYKFEVQVKNTTHDWESSKKGQIDFIVQKYYYQKINFMVLMSLIVLILAIIIFTLYDYIRHNRYIRKAKNLTRLVEEKTMNLKEVQQRELNHGKVSREILAKEIKKNTEKLTLQMDVILKQEKQIRETQKMEVVGQLTSGIAHDFNNMLSIIFIGADVIKKNLTKQEKNLNVDQKENLKWLDKVLQTSENCKEVIGQLMHFSRNNKESKTIIDVNIKLKDIVALIKITIPDTLNFSMDLMEKQGLINVDIPQFNQIILNLIINARDACNDYGEIKVITSQVSINKELSCAACGGSISGNFIEVQIIDNGKGIPEEILSSIFKPFFTVKENNLGSGIGLNVVDSNIHNMNGHVIVESKVRKGTTFRILLPISSEKLKQNDIVEISKTPRKKNKNINVLLVEDSASLVDLICLILNDAKINVDVAVDGIFGSESFYENPAKYDLIISDNSMPRLKGLDMAKKILQTHPSTKIVLLTGDVTGDVINEANNIGIVELLHKPIRADDLVEIVFNHVDL